MTKQFTWILVILFAFACKKPGNDPTPDPGPGGDPGNPPTQLTITAISPDNAEAGPVTITGTGFNTNVANNTVQFGALVATVKQASATQLIVDLPANLPQGDHDLTVLANNKVVTKTKAFHLIGWFVTNFAGTGATGSDDGAAASATFRQPMGITTDNAGNLYICDLNRIRRITPQGQVSTVAGGTGQFKSLTSIVRDNNGNLYVADAMDFTIKMITPAGSTIILAGKSGEFGYKDGVGEDARFSMPYGIAINASNTDLFIGDQANHRIRKIYIADREVFTIAGSGEQTSKDGIAEAAGIPSPGGLLITPDGMYITEKGGGRIRRMKSGDLSVTTVGGDLSVNTSPTHIAMDEEKNIYVTWSGMGKIKKYTPAGVESNLAGNNTGTGATEGPAQTVFFGRPEGIAVVKENGKLVFYVSDSQHKKIKKITKG